MFLSRLIQSIKKSLRGRKATQGYGLVMLMTFLSTTVMIGASMSIMMGPGVSSYLGNASQDGTAAKQLAEYGLETVIANIQTQLNAGTTISTSYTYPTTNISMASDPTTLGGSTVTVGSFSASIPYARSNTYLVKVTATVNSASAVLYKLVQANRNTSVLDSMTGPTLAFGLRKLRSAYGGSAIRVRRSSDNTEQDIGFDGNGNLDMDSLNTFLGTRPHTDTPMNLVNTGGGGLPVTAFGLRRLRANVNFGGYLIRVRRSSDNAEQDIGYTSTGDLDTNALLTFVGSDTGYVATWYDQSGNSRNATQTTASKQPTIVTSGQLNMLNNRPAIKYDGVDDNLTFTRAISDAFTIVACYSTIAGVGASDTSWASHAGIVDAYAGANTDSFGLSVDTSGNLYAGHGGTPDSSISVSNPGTLNDGRVHWLAMIRYKDVSGVGFSTVSQMTLFTDRNSYGLSSSNQNLLTAATNMTIGQLQNGSTASLSGYVNEVLVYGSGMSPSNLYLLKRNQSWYFNQVPDYAAPDYPLTTVNNNPTTGTGPAATAAYSLRKLRSAYAGSAIKVRRSSDNTLANIGFDGNGNLDVVTLLTFVGSGSGYVDTWYDQSGNGRDATQATISKQPMIVNAGVLFVYRAKPAIQFVSANSNNLSITTEVTGIGDFSAFGVAQAIGTIVGGASLNRVPLRTSSGGGVHNVNVWDNISNIWNNSQGMGVTWAVENFITTVIRSTNTWYLWHQGMSQGTKTQASAPGMAFGEIGSNLGGSFINGTISEVILYSTALGTTDRQTIEQSAQKYYAAPMPVGFVSKWYDQSGNGYDLTQTNPMLQPTLVMPRYGSALNRPTVNFNGGQRLTNSAGMPTNADYTKIAVFSYTSNGSNNIISSGGSHALWMAGGNSVSLYHNGATFATSSGTLSTQTNYAICGTYTESTKTGIVYTRNVAGTPGVSATSNGSSHIYLGSHSGSSYLPGTISEALVFARVLNAADRTALYSDERAYYAAQ